MCVIFTSDWLLVQFWLVLQKSHPWIIIRDPIIVFRPTLRMVSWINFNAAIKRRKIINTGPSKRTKVIFNMEEGHKVVGITLLVLREIVGSLGICFVSVTFPLIAYTGVFIHFPFQKGRIHKNGVRSWRFRLFIFTTLWLCWLREN